MFPDGEVFGFLGPSGSGSDGSSTPLHLDPRLEAIRVVSETPHERGLGSTRPDIGVQLTTMVEELIVQNHHGEGTVELHAPGIVHPTGKLFIARRGDGCIGRAQQARAKSSTSSFDFRLSATPSSPASSAPIEPEATPSAMSRTMLPEVWATICVGVRMPGTG